jgi:hypothetical protein
MASIEFLDTMFARSLGTLLERGDALDVILHRGVDGATLRTYDALGILIDRIVRVNAYISIGIHLKDTVDSWLQHLSWFTML